MIRHEQLQGDGVELHVARAGDGPPVILLHGFPEHWISWRHQIEALAAAGFSVLAPDMRGYNLSGKPQGKEPYRLRHLVADVAALVRATGSPRAAVVGHDWGGVVAWRFAGTHPELLDKLVILNSPHPKIFLKRVRRAPQLFKSLYMLFFQLPWIPEAVISAGDFRIIRSIFGSVFSAEEIAEHVEALRQPGALTAALNYYRAMMLRGRSTGRRSSDVAAETLVIWGERDPYLGIELLEGLERVVPHVRVHRIPAAGHWVQNEAPDEVNRVMLEFLTASPPS